MLTMKKMLALLICICCLFSMTAFAEDEPMPEMTHATIMFRQGPVRYIEGDSLYDNIYINGYRNDLNIDLEYVIHATGDEYTQKLTMAIASDDLPDILYLPIAEYTQLARAGKLWQMDDLIPQYANEITLKNFASDGGAMMEAAKVDGKLFGIPVGCFRNCPSNFLWIRADWLENPDVCIASMKQGTTPKGYIAYGHKSGKQKNGIIYDFGFADSVRQEEKASLIRWANDQVHSMGEAETGIWLIRDNLRARFLVESAGFHRHGDAREITRAGKSVTMVYYRDIRPQQVLQ